MKLNYSPLALFFFKKYILKIIALISRNVNKNLHLNIAYQPSKLDYEASSYASSCLCVYSKHTQQVAKGYAN